MFSLTRSVGTRNLVVYVIIVGYSDYISLNVRLDSPNVVTARHRTKISKENNFSVKGLVARCRSFFIYFSYKDSHTSPSPLGFLFSRPYWVPPTPHPQASVAPPPLWILRGGDTLACGEEVGAPSSDDWSVWGAGTGIEENKYMLFLIGSNPPPPLQVLCLAHREKKDWREKECVICGCDRWEVEGMEQLSKKYQKSVAVVFTYFCSVPLGLSSIRSSIDDLQGWN